MKHVYRYWYEERKEGTRRDGYSVADIYFQANAIVEENGYHVKDWYGKERKTLKAAINDAKRFYKKYPEAYFSIYAYATLTDYYEDGTLVRKPDNDCARIGSIIHDGEYFDLCESVDWLEEA